MQLNERICTLREERGMTQAELAEALNVSRQAVSKWETGTSTPALDKMVELSELFGVSLDQLVKGAPAAEPEREPAPEQEKPSVETPRSRARTAGMILMTAALVVGLLSAALFGLFGLLLAIPFVVLGGICLSGCRHPALWCVWAGLGMVDTYVRLAAGVSWGMVFWTLAYTTEMNVPRLATAWVMLLWRIILMTVTAYDLGREGKAPSRRKLLLLALVFAALHIPAYMTGLTGLNSMIWFVLLLLLSWCKLIAGTVLYTAFIRYRRAERRKN